MYIIYIGYFYNLIAYLQLDYTMVVCTQLYYFNIITPKIINKKMNGRRTKNQETLLYPSLQIRWSTHVQKRMYTRLNNNI